MNGYAVHPKADQDLDDQAYYYGSEGSPELGHRFLVSAHDTFALLATQPEIGWRYGLKHPGLEALRVFRVNGFERILILYWPDREGVAILRVVHGSRNLQAFFRREGIE